MGYCAKELYKSRCYLCPLINVCKFSRFTPIPKAKALRGKERKIFEVFLKIYGHEFDDVRTECPLGRYSADALLHKTSCETYITEVENELNYNAIGQVLTYYFLYFKIRGKTAKPMIICSRKHRNLQRASLISRIVSFINPEGTTCFLPLKSSKSLSAASLFSSISTLRLMASLIYSDQLILTLLILFFKYSSTLTVIVPKSTTKILKLKRS